MKLQEKVVPVRNAKETKEFLTELARLASNGETAAILDKPLCFKLGKELDGLHNIVGAKPAWANWDILVNLKVDNHYFDFTKNPKDFIFFSLKEND